VGLGACTTAPNGSLSDGRRRATKLSYDALDEYLRGGRITTRT
jgi:hypothetical protein